MEIFINGQQRQVPDDIHAVHLLDLFDLKDQRVAIELNLEIIPRGELDQTRLHPGDRIEIVRAIGGG